MDLFDIYAKITLDDSAYNDKVKDAVAGGKKLANAVGSGLATAAKIGGAAITAAAGGIVALTTQSVKAYADYEQLVGGVETLFEASADTVQGYAARAYKTAGLSANEYMETVTGFSASLLQSLGGDTAKAADVADQAIRDMSDNANKMGTAMESIQVAYQGFAKQNYTMLDNLKLGYGGTKEEMERLLADAQAISGIEYNLDSYADVIEAIHVIQTEMGITGTTAKEAEKTISGSLSAAKSSFKNLVVGISDEKADLDLLVGQFVDSVGIAAENLIPRVEQALDGGLAVVEKITPKIMATVPDAVVKFGPRLVASGGEIIKSLAHGIRDNKGQIIEAGKTMLQSGIDSLLDLGPDIIDTGFDLFSGIVDAFPDVAIQIVQGMPEITGAFVEGLGQGFQAVSEAATALLNPLNWDLSDFRRNMKEAVGDVTPFAEMVENAASNLLDLNKIMSDKGRTISEIDSKVAETEEKISQIISEEYKKQDGYRKRDIESLRKYQQEIQQLQEEKLGIYRSQSVAELQKIKLEINEMDAEAAAQHLANAQKLLKDSNEYAEEIYTQELTQLENYYASRNESGSADHQRAMQAAKLRHDEMVKENQRYYDDIIGVVQGGAQDIAGINGLSLTKTEIAAKEMSQKQKQVMADWAKVKTEAGKYVGEGVESASQYSLDMVHLYADTLGEFDYQGTNAFISLLAMTKEQGGKLTEENKFLVDQILDFYDTMPAQLSEDAKEGILAMIAGMEDQIPGLENASEMSAKEISDTLREYLLDGKQMEKLGADTVQSFAYGVEGKKGWLNDAVSQMLNSVLANASPKPTPGGKKPSFGRVAIDGSHADGLPYVPYDGYIAELHKGERVLTAHEAQQISSTRIGDVHIHIDGAGHLDSRELAEEVAERIQQMADDRRAVYG